MPIILVSGLELAQPFFWLYLQVFFVSILFLDSSIKGGLPGLEGSGCLAKVEIVP